MSTRNVVSQLTKILELVTLVLADNTADDLSVEVCRPALGLCALAWQPV